MTNLTELGINFLKDTKKNIKLSELEESFYLGRPNTLVLSESAKDPMDRLIQEERIRKIMDKDFDKKLKKIIEETGIFNELDDGLNIIEEAFGSSMQMRSFDSKKQAAIAAIAVALAKKNNDPLYEMLKRHRSAWKKAKDELVARYAGQAEAKFQQNMTKR